MLLKDKKILVVGLGITGTAVARFLKKRGALVTVTDISDEETLGDCVAPIRELNIPMELGFHQTETFANADCIVMSPGVAHTIEPVRQAKEKGVPVIGEIELASRFIKEPVIAVTGTNGKTTTTSLLGEMLRSSGFQVFVGGNIGNPLIEYVDQEKKADRVVIEVSSFQLDTIDTFKPAVGVLLNITEDHLDRYDGFREYALSKFRIFENQTPADTAVLNGSDPAVREMGETIKSKKVFFTTLLEDEKGAVISNDEICLKLNGTKNSLTSGSLEGKHNLENISAAALAALAAGGTMDGIQSAVNNFKGLHHRIEFVDTVSGASYFNDSKATNVDAALKALESFKHSVILIMGGRDKGGDYRVLTDQISQHVKMLIVMGEAKDKIKNALDRIVPVKTAGSMEDAVFSAYQATAPGDTVLLSPACSSFDMYTGYAQRGEAFCEAVKILKQRTHER